MMREIDSGGLQMTDCTGRHHPIKLICPAASVVENRTRGGTTLVELISKFYRQEAGKHKNPCVERSSAMATSEVMEADSGFGRAVQSPGDESNLVVKISGEDSGDEAEDIVGEGLFSFDEDLLPEEGTDKTDDGYAASGVVNNVHSNDSGHFDMSHAHSAYGGGISGFRRMWDNPWAEDKADLSDSEPGEDDQPGSNIQPGTLGYGSSLPITIPGGRFWPPHDAVDSVKHGETVVAAVEDPGRADRTVLPQRAPRDLYSEMRAQARSVQAVDDPERLFGERPSRRRYQTGQATATSQVNAAPQPYYEDALVVVAANVKEHM